MDIKADIEIILNKEEGMKLMDWVSVLAPITIRPLKITHVVPARLGCVRITMESLDLKELKQVIELPIIKKTGV